MRNSTKIAIGVVGAFGIWKLANLLTKAKNLTSNIMVSAAPDGVSVKGLSALLKFNVTLTNYSGFSLPVSNLFSKLILVNKNGFRTETGVSNIANSITFENNQVKNFKTAFTIDLITLTSTILGGGLRSIDIVTYYDFKGQQISTTKTIDLPNFLTKAKGNNALLGGSNML